MIWISNCYGLTKVLDNFTSIEGVCALWMVDIDHFERINDCREPLEGNQVMVHVAEVLTSPVRALDIVVRWGALSCYYREQMGRKLLHWQSEFALLWLTR
ncbi:GGDEF domain-containing protein [Gilvimarinus chinensis]|uniref:GGDEF domain-containing protein n=1 Tax=Gilvimarinus chinensis TaxID=396005 RepID=UPI0009FD805C